MPNQVFYEWDYEIVEDGDVIEHNHRDNLSQFRDPDKTDTLVLVRDEGNQDNGLENRSWAYVNDGKLPEYFADSYGNKETKVPLRFHKELAAYLSKQSVS